MVYYSVSKDFEEIYLHFDSAPDSITVWRLKDNGWEWDNKGKRWQNKYCKATRRYARELSGSNVPTFVIPKGCYSTNSKSNLHGHIYYLRITLLLKGGFLSIAKSRTTKIETCLLPKHKRFREFTDSWNLFHSLEREPPAMQVGNKKVLLMPRK